VTPEPPDRRRPLCRVLATTLLLVLSAGCTGGSSDDEGRSLPRRSVGQQPTLEAKPVPMDVKVAKQVGGRLRREQRTGLERKVGRLLSAYFDDAFLGGEYPRSNFKGALATFSPGAARRAGDDRDLLTNAGTGGSTEAVVARTKQARLDVLVPGRNVVGLTARIRLVFLQQPLDGVDREVTVTGRLLLGRSTSGPWEIFGYDVTRSSVPAEKGDS
jgi:hypothetical protein